MKNSEVKPFEFEGKKFMPYPQRKPKDYKPIKVLTDKDLIFDVIQIDTGFGREFINEMKRIHLFPENIKGWWYL